MLNINDRDISVNRQNDVTFTVSFEGDDAPEDGVSALFVVSRSPRYGIAEIQKKLSVSEGQIVVHLETDDTTDLAIGTYYWNIILFFNDGAEPWTVFEDAATFELLPETGGTPYGFVS